MKKQIRICGFGGQGIILAGVILGEAATRAGYEAVQTQSYGPESRGGAARSEVVISSEPIDYPRVTKADVVVALSQEGFDKYTADLSEDGVVVVDQDLVEANGAQAQSFTATAEELGHKIVSNIVMLGYLAARLDFIPDDILEETVLDNIPKGTEELNRRAVHAGRALHRGSGE
ncbi:MAG: 2-oxoacid:ferredoxin oxidoreductase subunit gamma [bacterium]|nr:2-oxoacid:ferredoxin oxidoreductase subunit gamma [bacterium]